MRRWIGYALLLSFIPASAGASFGQRFFGDDPVWADPDTRGIPEPAQRELSKAYDFLENTYRRRADMTARRSVNINTLGEVPDSSWFTNRLGAHEMSIDELVRGPNPNDGPDMSQPWEVVSGKHAGITPGLWIRDGRGDFYLLKFDPPGYPQLSTSTEVIATKLLYAAGYHVPANYLVQFEPGQLRIGGDARFSDRYGVKRAIRQRDLERILRQIPRLSDGKIQASASLRLEGKPLGPFKFYGTRADDPNDIFPHEDRRELRGYRVFSAWLNHNDSDAANTLDTLVEEGGRRYIRHHLIDFGTTLGSAAYRPKFDFNGHEYYFQGKPTLKAALLLGFWKRSWQAAEYPDLPSIGAFGATHFHPPDWKPDYPNPAFDKMDSEDAFWAARIVQRFSDEAIRAVVRTGRLEDPEAEEYLVQTLIERRDKIVRYYLAELNPIDGFEIRRLNGAPSLRFVNPGLRAGLSTSVAYQYRWYRFDNETESVTPIGTPQTETEEELPLPADVEAPYLVVKILTIARDQPNWDKEVWVFVRSQPAPAIVGIERPPSGHR
jgi:hypothetical protein